MPTDDLDTHGKRTIVEADRHPRNRNPGHRPGNNRLHPPVIRVHRPPVDVLGPVSVLVERKHLSTRRENVVVGFEHLGNGRQPAVAGLRGLGHVESRQCDRVLEFPQQFGLHQLAQARIVVLIDQAELCPPTPPQEQLPDVLGFEVGKRRLDAAPQLFEDLERGFAQLENSRFGCQVTVPVTDPCDPRALQITCEAFGEYRGILTNPQRCISIRPRHRGKQVSHVGDGSAHRAHNGALSDESRLRYPTPGWSKPNNVVECRRVSERTHVIASVSHRQHAERQRRGGASAATAGSARIVVRRHRRTPHRVVRLGSEPELRCVRLADHDGTGRPDPLDEQFVIFGDSVREHRRPGRERQTLGRRKILHRMRKPVHPTEILPTRQLRITLARLRRQRFPIPQCDDRVHRRVM